MTSFLGALKSKVGLSGRDDDREPDEERQNGQDGVDDMRRRPDDDVTGYTDEDGYAEESGSGNSYKDGHLVVQGVDLGVANPSAMNGPEDILALLHIDANVEVPDTVYLPEDLQTDSFPGFDDETPGFAKQQVADFFDRAYMSAEYLKKMLSRRNKDIMALANYVDGLNKDLQDKNVEMEIQRSTGMSLIAGDDSKKVMDLTVRNKKLQAQIDELRKSGAGVGDEDMRKELADLKERCAKLQDQLGMEQYTNRDLSNKLEDLKGRMDLDDESSGNGIDELTEDIGGLDPVDLSRDDDPHEIELGDRPSGARRPARRDPAGAPQGERNHVKREPVQLQRRHTVSLKHGGGSAHASAPRQQPTRRSVQPGRAAATGQSPTEHQEKQDARTPAPVKRNGPGPDRHDDGGGEDQMISFD